MRQVIAYSTLLLTVSLAVTRPRVAGRWRIGPATAAFGGVLVLLAVGIVVPSDLRSAAGELWRPFLTIASIMVMTVATQRLGVLDQLAEMVFARADRSATQLFGRVFVLSAVTSSVLNNDAMVLLLTPLVLALVKRRYPGHTRLLLPFAFAVFTAVGVAPFVISNPMNMIVAAYARLNFNQYASWMIPISLAGWAVAYPILRLLFAKELSAPAKFAPPKISPRLELSRPQRMMTGLLLLVVAGYPVVALIDGPSIWVVALCGALGALWLAGRSGGIDLRDLLVRGVAWDVLVFLLCAFVLALGLRNVGFTELLASIYHGAGVALIGSVAAAGSAVINNHPMAIINLLALEATPTAGRREILAMLLGGDLGPRLLPVGSLAGLLWLEACRRMEVRVSLAKFVGVGLAVTVPTMAVSLLILYLR